MNDKLLKLRSVLKTIPLNDNQINNILGIIDTQNKELYDTITPLLEEYYSYGVEKDFRIDTSDCIRVGNLDLHRSLPIHSRMRGCLLDDDGNIVEYLPENDWTTARRDGSKGQVMVHIPHHYRRFYTKDNNNIICVRISELPLKGYHYVPDMFIGAYEAALDRVNLKLCSVVNDSTNFRGGDNTSNWDNTYRSLLGRPCTNKNRYDFQKYARNRRNIYWNEYLYQCYQTLCWLYVIEYANFNCQLPYDNLLTSNGYHQGGLGKGVTAIEKWLKFNNNNPFIPCGYTDSLGNNTGIIDYTLYNEDNTIFNIVYVPRYRGIENPFGHIWKILSNVNIIISADTANGGNGLSKLYICEDLTKFSDTSVDDYIYIGNLPRANGYVKTLIFGENGHILPASINGTSTYPIGDYFNTAIPSSGEDLRIMIIDGNSADTTEAGLFFNNTVNVTERAASFTGTRLCYIRK